MKDNGITSARRSEQYSGNAKEGDSDVIAEVELPSWHLESKGTRDCRLKKGQLNEWLVQVEHDCNPDQIAVIINSANKKEKIAILPLDTYRKVMSLLGNGFNTQCETGSSLIPTEILTDNKSRRKLLNYMMGGDIAKNALNFDAICFCTCEDPYRVCVIIEGLTWLELAKNYEGRLKASLVPNELLKSIA